MYTMHMDGVQMFNTDVVDDPAFVVLNPMFCPDTGGNSSLSFVLPPGSRMHGSIQKMKSIVTLEQDGEQIFRGRVLDVESDFYNQKTVYCDGDKSFLLDSLHEPYTYEGTVHGLFQKLIANHNQHVDVEKRFTIGQITAVSSSETVKIETEVYCNTSVEIEEKLVDAYGGYLRTRTVGNTTYLDWLEQYGDVNAQPIEFSVNLLDLKNKADAGDVFTVLIPLGASELNENGEYSDPLTVDSVNNGKNYIQDDASVALYGKIWRTHSWSHEDDPQKLLEKGREYLKTGAVLETLTLKAVDMHFVDGNVRPIRVGDRVRILSNPHGVDKTVMCTSMEVDLLNPENTVYTFGEKPRTLTENYVKTEEEVGGLTGGGRGGGKSVKQEISEIIRWAEILKDPEKGFIHLTAGEYNKTTKRLDAAEIRIDGAEANIELAASSLDDIEGSLTSVGIELDGIGGAITSKVEKSGVISAINQTAEKITISASKIDLDGYVTSSMLSAELVNIQNAFATSIGTFDLSATNIACATLNVGGQSAQWYTSPEFVKSVSLKGTSPFAVQATDGIIHTIYAGYSISTSKDSISYLG